MYEKLDFKISRLTQGFEWNWTTQRHPLAVWWLCCLQFWCWIYWGCLGENTGGFHLLVAITHKPRTAYQHASEWCQLIAAAVPVPDFQGSLPKSSPIEQNHESVIGPRRENPQKSTKYRCYLQKNCLVLSHNSIIFVTDAYERRTQTWSTGIFVKWHALLPPPQCSGHFCLAARMFFVFFFSPMLVLKKETSLLNKNNPKTFSTVLKYSKGYQPTLWIKKKRG